MNLIKLFNNTKNKSTRNRKALKVLISLKYPKPNIYRALVHLNDINLINLSDRNVSYVTLNNVVKNKSKNYKARKLLANEMGLKVRELFSD